ncbi:uncharacterized protein LOC135170491 isoform X1 [Diachasmimorpha longicaudata]|uniref:uncharacterized protein LOC135170491 isoform X1 n=1 Tax=Diachasmimorpha longicaudata TaxID=58733 RepID=UPI0030B86AD4
MTDDKKNDDNLAISYGNKHGKQTCENIFGNCVHNGALFPDHLFSRKRSITIVTESCWDWGKGGVQYRHKVKTAMFVRCVTRECTRHGGLWSLFNYLLTGTCKSRG